VVISSFPTLLVEWIASAGSRLHSNFYRLRPRRSARSKGGTFWVWMSSILNSQIFLFVVRQDGGLANDSWASQQPSGSKRGDPVTPKCCIVTFRSRVKIISVHAQIRPERLGEVSRNHDATPRPRSFHTFKFRPRVGVPGAVAPRCACRPQFSFPIFQARAFGR
jgi:hypothetical protein